MIRKTARLFQERRIPADRKTVRLPMPRLVLENSLIHRLPLQPPYPIPEVKQQEGTETDTRHTRVWPYGEETIE